MSFLSKIAGSFQSQQVPNANMSVRDGGYNGTAYYDIGPFKLKSGQDLSGTTSAAINYWMQQQQNAYDLDLWNKANEYNSPLETMKRYQDAGLNPNLAYGNTSNVSPAGSSAPIPTRPTNYAAENKLKKMQLAQQGIGQVGELLEQVQKVVDYALYGAEGHSLSNDILRSQNDALQASNRFKQYFLYPMQMSKAGGGPQTVVTPEGETFTIDWTQSLEAAKLLASANHDWRQVDLIDFMMNNIYPLQGQKLQQDITAGSVAAQSNARTIAVYNEITNGLNIENPILQLVAWKLATKAANLDTDAAKKDAQSVLLLLAKTGLL